MPIPFHEMARLPAPGDNVAIAVRRLAAGTRVILAGAEFTLDHTVLEGHRFAVRPIAPGQALLSWELPFGRALRLIGQGEYACNAAMLEALRGRRVDFALPAAPNFADAHGPFDLDEAAFTPGAQVGPAAAPLTFQGYPRAAGRGVGTRNYLLVLGVTSRAAGFARRLAERAAPEAARFPNVSGVAPVAHTEGGARPAPHNLEFALRALAGFAVHPNVGAVLFVDAAGPDPLTNDRLRAYLREHDYPLDAVPHAFLTLGGDFEADLARGAAVLAEWLPEADAASRRVQPLSDLAIALQCGGSDAFSGVSGNPLAGAVAREIVRCGGQANLAETDELMGAEAYALQNVRDLATARAFLARLARFKERLAWHGVTPEGNPSGGNRYRGLYNIALKSIGAARKRDPQVRLDHVIDYAQRMRAPGFYFMDSPGNDLESVAGQAASGANLIFFVTGNGSITNFPFVPTIKFVTTTGRYNLLPGEMDVNAGRYLDGEALEDLAQEALALAVRVASGERTRGELAGHSQVSLWRDWPQADASRLEALQAAPEPPGLPILIRTDGRLPGDYRFEARPPGVGLIAPTSLCAGQVARLAAERLNRAGAARFAALVHTEGCGFAGRSAYTLYPRILLNYLAHPLVARGLLLEHGCEKTHNDFMRERLEDLGRDPAQYGWASIQLDGGLEKVLAKVEAWFAEALAAGAASPPETVGLERLRLGLLAAEGAPAPAARALACVAQTVVAGGGVVVVPETSTALLAPIRPAVDPVTPSGAGAFPITPNVTPSPVGARGLASNMSASAFDESEASFTPSLAFGALPAQPGFYVMECPTAHSVETLTGLGATGVAVMLSLAAGGPPLPAHPFVPLLQIAAAQGAPGYDLALSGDEDAWAEAMLRLILETVSQRYAPRLARQGIVDFQITRGLLGVST